MARTQISLDRETQNRARTRASELGISLAEYVRQLISRDLDYPDRNPDISCIFNLGSSGGSNIAREKDAMIADAFDRARKKLRKSA